jgi:hypothetical protein
MFSAIGFFAPPISTDLITMLEVMPNIISLPYGKCPPLHLQGPSWRHLLMLMARLSGTRIEATPEAVAVNKTELKLRTVVQFVKVCHRSVLQVSRNLDSRSATSYIVRMADNTLFYSGLPFATFRRYQAKCQRTAIFIHPLNHPNASPRSSRHSNFQNIQYSSFRCSPVPHTTHHLSEPCDVSARCSRRFKEIRSRQL